MLTISMKTWLATALAALLALAAGITVAASLDPNRPAGAPALGLLAQGGGCDDNPNDRNCGAWDEVPPSPGPGGDPDDPNPGGGGGGCFWTERPQEVADDTDRGSQFVLVAQSGIQIPCNHPVYGFYADGCYYGDTPALVEPPDGPPEGQTEEDGAWYFERCIFDVQVFNGELVFTFPAILSWRWFENGEVPVALPTPEEVAQAWLASITLDGVEIQLAPPDTGVGVVNLPVWIGVAPTETSWGTIADSDCDDTGTVCVTIEALVVDVDWDMGDGTVVTCTRDQHEPWAPGMNYLSPGNNHCHHYYRRASRNQPDGKYQITATSNWEVRWVAQASGVGDVILTTAVAETALQIDEIQVLTR